jgi:hypothetical protein
MPLVGRLSTRAASEVGYLVSAFRQGLKDVGLRRKSKMLPSTTVERKAPHALLHASTIWCMALAA